MVRTREQLVEEIHRLEVEASRLEAEAGGNICVANTFPQYLKIIRKVQKLRNQL
jgi:hypothetical protein